MFCMRRREFITLLGGAAAWPLAAPAQQPERMRRIGVLMGLAETDHFTQGYVRELRDRLQQLGWTDGRNAQFTYRYAAGDPGVARAFAKELVDTQPDLIVGHTTPVIAALSQTTRTVPVVFVSIADPVLNGFVASMARPAGNMTGFTNYEFAMGAKWLEVLKEIAPTTSRVSLLLNPDTGSYYVQYLRSIETVALSSSVQATLAPVHDADEIGTTISALAREPGGGLIVLPSAPITGHIEVVIGLAAQFRTPAVYPFGSYARQGGLVSYGVELNDLFRRAAEYVDRVLRGEKPADLPVQAPTKYELVINLKTAKALGIDVPPMLLARADEVIE
jgi:putative tryptophan/tyrosine transport system substrate-binding protein